MRPMKSVFINVKKGIRNTYYLYTSSDKDIIKDKIQNTCLKETFFSLKMVTMDLFIPSLSSWFSRQI